MKDGLTFVMIWILIMICLIGAIASITTARLAESFFYIITGLTLLLNINRIKLEL